MALKPAATKASSSLNEAGSSAVHPNTFPPKTRGEISSPELPSLRLFISILPKFVPRICPSALDEISTNKGTRHGLAAINRPSVISVAILRVLCVKFRKKLTQRPQRFSENHRVDEDRK